jgi:hypothetical protein
MPNRYHGQSGEQILAGLKSRLAASNQILRGHIGRDDLPAEYRRRIRAEAIADARATSQDAWQAFQAWASQKMTEARQELAADETGSQADELRKMRQEQKISRLIETARLADERNGPKNIGGTIVRNEAARNLAAEAERLFLNTTDYHGAVAHATAAIALGVDATKWRDLAQTQIWLQDPAKRSALRDLDLVERAQQIFVRDNASALAAAYSAAADEARDQGDDPSTYLRAAVAPSMTAKVTAQAIAQRDGKPYEPPAGTLASTPTPVETA